MDKAGSSKEVVEKQVTLNYVSGFYNMDNTLLVRIVMAHARLLEYDTAHTRHMFTLAGLNAVMNEDDLKRLSNKLQMEREENMKRGLGAPGRGLAETGLCS